MNTKGEKNMGERKPNTLLTRQVVVANSHGIHARPAGKLAQLAQSFAADISIAVNGQEVDAKSILDLLTLAASQGTALELRATGHDAATALDQLEELITSHFKEE